jgi:ABC-2 type transport system permease protein
MRKYFTIYKATLIDRLQYTLNLLFGLITFFILMFVFMNLWSYIYSDTTNLINGYSREQMIWYIIVAEIIWFGTRNRTLTNQISDDIKNGGIAYGINKPYHYVAYIVAKHLGEISIQFILFSVAGVLLGTLFVGNVPSLTLYQLPLALLSLILGIFVNTFLRMTISILSFWIEDCLPFHWIYDKLLILVGTMFPVEMFPVWAQPIIRATPIFVVTYGPAKLMIDYSLSMALQVISSQLIYLVVSLGLLLLLYRKGVKKLYVNGG